jgi:hypothetical protein
MTDSSKKQAMTYACWKCGSDVQVGQKACACDQPIGGASWACIGGLITIVLIAVVFSFLSSKPLQKRNEIKRPQRVSQVSSALGQGPIQHYPILVRSQALFQPSDHRDRDPNERGAEPRFGVLAK